ncbi:hypothetical protein PR048_024726 [Dryococelus australis]|uniref:Uncharacterized protein n=1 Tax=Dryococelus australis TaxID=614101 RepID=A0ABQ9GPD1_9NEOP|nr:hypothetical protein PR048_024726 [Dryococelus australis]
MRERDGMKERNERERDTKDGIKEKDIEWGGNREKRKRGSGNVVEKLLCFRNTLYHRVFIRASSSADEVAGGVNCCFFADDLFEISAFFSLAVICEEVWAALNIEVFRACEGEVRRAWSSAGMRGRGKEEMPGKICRLAASSDTTPTLENSEATPSGIETGSSRCEASCLTAGLLETAGFRGDEVVRLFAFHQGVPYSIPGGVIPEFSHVAIVPHDAAGRRVFSGISRFPHPCIPALFPTHLASSSSALKTSMLRATQISLLTHSLLETQPMAIDKLFLGAYSIEVYRVLIFFGEKSLALSIMCSSQSEPRPASTASRGQYPTEFAYIKNTATLFRFCHFLASNVKSSAFLIILALLIHRGHLSFRENILGQVVFSNALQFRTTFVIGSFELLRDSSVCPRITYGNCGLERAISDDESFSICGNLSSNSREVNAMSVFSNPLRANKSTYRARWRSGNSLSSHSVRPGFDSRSGHPDFGSMEQCRNEKGKTLKKPRQPASSSGTTCNVVNHTTNMSLLSLVHYVWPTQQAMALLPWK